MRPRRNESQPSPTHERLRQRTILAARRLDLLQLDWPDEIALLPLGGRRLSADLQAAITGLDRLARTNPDETFRASLALAVILAGVGRHETAIAAANRALLVSPFSPRGFLIRPGCGSSRATSGEHATTSAGASRFSSTSPVCSSSGEFSRQKPTTTRALSTTSIWRSLPAPVDRIHLHKARSLVALGNHSAAVQEWSLACDATPNFRKPISAEPDHTSSFANGTWRWLTWSRPPHGPTPIPVSSSELCSRISSVLPTVPTVNRTSCLSHGAPPPICGAAAGQFPDAIGSLIRPAEAFAQRRAVFRRVGSAHRSAKARSVGGAQWY